MKCAYLVYSQYCCKKYAEIKKKYGYCDLTEYKCRMLHGLYCNNKTNSIFARIKTKIMLRR